MTAQAAFRDGARAVAAEQWRRALRLAGDPPDGLRWFYVSLPRATFAVGVLGGRVVTGPPYMRRQIALGRQWADLAGAWRNAADRRPDLGDVIIKPLP